MVESFKEVKRTLKPGGNFCIIMDSNGLHCEELKEIAKQENCTFYTDEDLSSYLLEAEFSVVTSIIRQRKTSTKLIKHYESGKYFEEVVNDEYELDHYVEGEISGRVPTSPEWMCIIAQK